MDGSNERSVGWDGKEGTTRLAGDHFAPLIAFRGNQTKSGFGLLFS